AVCVNGFLPGLAGLYPVVLQGYRMSNAKVCREACAMETQVPSEQALPAKLVEVTSRLESLGHDLLSVAELRRFVEQLQAERDLLRRRVATLEAERSQLLHAWANQLVSEEELERRSREPGGCSLAELLARLEQG